MRWLYRSAMKRLPSPPTATPAGLFDAGMKESIHLVTQPGVHPAAVAVNTECPHELGERVPQDKFAALGSALTGPRFCTK